MSRARSGWTSKATSPHRTSIRRIPRAGPSLSTSAVLLATWSIRPTRPSRASGL
jgi:hypothetical protein